MLCLLSPRCGAGGWYWWRAHCCLCGGGWPRWITSSVLHFSISVLLNHQYKMSCTTHLCLRWLWVPGNPEGGGTRKHWQPQPQHHLDRPWQFPSGMNMFSAKTIRQILSGRELSKCVWCYFNVTCVSFCQLVPYWEKTFRIDLSSPQIGVVDVEDVSHFFYSINTRWTVSQTWPI